MITNIHINSFHLAWPRFEKGAKDSHVLLYNKPEI